jgi:N-methylhydantoinase B
MVVTINGNCRNTPVEVFETRYPAFRIESYRLVTDSGGPGEFRGGLGGERVFTVTVPEVTVSALLNRMKTEPWGVLGGGVGAVGGLWVRRAGTEPWRTFVEEFGTMSPSKFSGVTLREGDQVKILMPGGGGYGDPMRRDRALVRRDIEEGFVGEEAARTLYGLDPEGA